MLCKRVSRNPVPVESPVEPRGPGWIVEFRNHHISNAGAAGENLGVNAAAIVTGVQWVLR